MDQEVIYLKVDNHKLVNKKRVTIADAMKIEGSNETLVDGIKGIVLYNFEERPKVVVFSIMKVIEKIHRLFPEVICINIGESDFIIEYEEKNTKGQWKKKVKIGVICLLTFFGSVFTIMAFHNDISINGIFERFYMQFTGMKKPPITEIEVAYSIGLAVGILLFFNHVGKKKITADPTPIQVKMRDYENERIGTLIENAERKGHSQDVD